MVRTTATEQNFMIATKCSGIDKPLKFYIQLLFTVRDVRFPFVLFDLFSLFFDSNRIFFFLLIYQTFNWTITII